MATIQKSLRIPHEIAKAIEEMAEASSQAFSTVASELLAEGLKIRRCPGILFTDGPSGRRARIAGTGLDVWELIATHHSLGGDLDRLRQAYHWLSDPQLRAARGYYAAYPDEIERQIARNDVWTKERLVERYPSLATHRP